MQSLFLALLAALILSAASPLCADGLKPEEFKDAIRAQDQEEWKQSGELLAKALKKQGEDGSRTRISGGRYISYLPHYYMGLALYHQEDCAGAMKEWDQSLKIGAVQTKSEYATLLKHQQECSLKLH